MLADLLSRAPGLPLDDRDELRITVAGLTLAEQIRVGARSWRSKTETLGAESITITGGGTGVDTAVLPLAKGRLFSAAADVLSATLNNSAASVLVELRNGADTNAPIIAILFQAAITPDAPAGWNAGGTTSGSDAPDNPRQFLPSPPAAGNDFLLTPSTSGNWTPELISFTLQTGAAVATRLANITMRRGPAAGDTITFGPIASQAANLTFTYIYSRHHVVQTTTIEALTNTRHALWDPKELTFFGQIESAITNMQAADALTNIVLWYRQRQF